MHELTKRLGINADYPDSIIRLWLEDKVDSLWKLAAMSSGPGTGDDIRKILGLTEEEKGIAPLGDLIPSDASRAINVLARKLEEVITEFNALKKGKK